jgi:hypothetical protein
MTVTTRRGTCVHEAGHAVVSYLLGVRFFYIGILDDAHGEVVPESSCCPTCVDYYEKWRPSADPQSKRIQDDFRRQAAVAVAGEIAERELAPGSSATDAELAQDREQARTRASFIHFWTSEDCRRESWWGDDAAICSHCDAFLEPLRAQMAATLWDPTVSAAVIRLAERLDAEGRLCWDEAVDLLRSHLPHGSLSVDLLPPAPPEVVTINGAAEPSVADGSS